MCVSVCGDNVVWVVSVRSGLDGVWGGDGVCQCGGGGGLVCASVLLYCHVIST